MPNQNSLSGPKRKGPKNENQISALAGINVLIVEDEEINQAYLQAILARLGVQTNFCDNGSIAVELIRDQSSTIDVVLLDLKIPGIDGWQVADQVRRMGVEIPILAISAAATNESEYVARGFNGLVGKPILKSKLIEKLSEVLIPATNVDLTNSILRQDDETRILPNPKALTSNESAIQKLTDQFTSKIQSKLPQIESAISNDSFDEVDSIGHWLKGTALNLRLRQLARIAERLEASGQHKNAVLAIQAFQQLKHWTDSHQNTITKSIATPHAVLHQTHAEAPN
ncbi:MAG: response regulator [Planctomycetota bacterium]